MKKFQTWWGLAFALPAILGFFFWNAGPMIASFVIATTEWGIVGRPRFIGFENFKIMWEDFLFWKSLGVTFYYAAGSVIAINVTAFLCAILLNQRVKGQALFRTIFFLPSLTPLIANAVVWLWLFNPTFGLLNYFLRLIGLSRLQWIYSESQVIPSLILMSAWGMGFTMVIYLAGLQGIPKSLYEAVEVDGGGWWHKFRHITIPMMTPVMFFTLVIGMIGSLQGFVQPFVMTAGGPRYASWLYVYNIYVNAFRYGKMGYACALATVFFLVILVLTILVFKSSPYWVYYETLTGRRR